MRRTNVPIEEFYMEEGIAMTLKKIVGTGAIAGALGLSALGLAGVANAAPVPQPAPGEIQHVQLTDWHGGGGDRDGGGGGWHGDRDGGGGGWHGDRDGGWGGWHGGDRDGR
jgi:hypothetical protein